MTDKLEKALEELDTLLEEVNTLRKEEEKSPAADADLEMNEATLADEEELMDPEAVQSSEYIDGAAKSVTTLDAETGEPASRVVIENGNPVGDKQAKVVKAFDNGEITSLNLSPDVIEKAYSEYKSEQLEKIALGNLEKTFANRFKSEVSERNNIISKANYDAKSEVSALKEELADLRKSFSTGKSEILKAQQTESVKLPSMDDVANMSWADLNRLAGN